MTTDSFTIRSIEAFCYRYPLATPVVTSFGKMLNRPAVFVRAVDEDGVEGWGEAWSNFPAPGAEHRARLVNEVLAPGLVGRKFDSPAQAFEILTKGTAVLALQSRRARSVRAGDLGHRSRAVGPLRASAQACRCGGCSGAVAQDQGLCQRHQSGRRRADGRSRAHARPSRVEAEDRLRCRDRSRQSGRAARDRRAGMLAADANQGWSVDQALEMLPRSGRVRSALAGGADPRRPAARGMAPAAGSATMPIAAGENISSRRGIRAASWPTTCSASFSPISRNGAG